MPEIPRQIHQIHNINFVYYAGNILQVKCKLKDFLRKSQGCRDGTGTKRTREYCTHGSYMTIPTQAAVGFLTSYDLQLLM